MHEAEPLLFAIRIAIAAILILITFIGLICNVILISHAGAYMSFRKAWDGAPNLARFFILSVPVNILIFFLYFAGHGHLW